MLPAPHNASILTDQAQACIPVPAPSQTRLPPISVCRPSPSLTPVHAEVALGADGLDEAVRPVVKGMAISCGQLDPGPESGKGSQCCLYPLCSSRADREAKDCQGRDLSQACPVIFFPFLKSRSAGAEIKGGSCTLTPARQLSLTCWHTCAGHSAGSAAVS